MERRVRGGPITGRRTVAPPDFISQGCGTVSSARQDLPVSAPIGSGRSFEMYGRAAGPDPLELARDSRTGHFAADVAALGRAPPASQVTTLNQVTQSVPRNRIQLVPESPLLCATFQSSIWEGLQGCGAVCRPPACPRCRPSSHAVAARRWPGLPSSPIPSLCAAQPHRMSSACALHTAQRRQQGCSAAAVCNISSRNG